MALVATFPGDVAIYGALIGVTEFAYPDGSIVNADISPAAAIEAIKLQRSLRLTISQSGTAATATYTLAVVKGATGTVTHVTCSNLIDCVGLSTVTVDVQKNGVTILTAVITLDVATGDLGEENGVIAVPDLVDGDVLTVIITANANGTDPLATGVLVQVDMDEDRP